MDDLMIFDGYVNQLASKNGVLLEWGSQIPMFLIGIVVWGHPPIFRQSHIPGHVWDNYHINGCFNEGYPS